MRGACVSQMFIRAYRPDEREGQEEMWRPGLRQLFFSSFFFLLNKSEKKIKKRAKLQTTLLGVGFTTT